MKKVLKIRQEHNDLKLFFKSQGRSISFSRMLYNRKIRQIQYKSIRQLHYKGVSSIKFPLRLKQFFTLKKFITILIAALFSCICRLCFLLYLPGLSPSSFTFLFPTSLGSILAGAIAGLYYDHFLVIEVQEITKPLSGMNYDKFFMNNQGSNNNTSGFTNTIPEIWNPIEHHYSHGTHMTSKIILDRLNADGQAIGLFKISNVSKYAKSCTITFLKPLPNLNNIAEVDLLARLVKAFPHGEGYVLPLNGGTLDEYRLQGYLRIALDNANDAEDWKYKSDQNRPEGMSPYFDKDKNKGYYQPWASDIANSISKHRLEVGDQTDNRVCLDSYSTIFLATFKNAHPELSATATSKGGPIVTQLRKL